MMEELPTTLADDELPSNLQEAVEAAREGMGQPLVPVAKHGNDYMFWVGEWDLTTVGLDWEQDTCHAFQVVKPTFPDGGDVAHWITVAPKLSLRNGRLGQVRSPRSDQGYIDLLTEMGYESALSFSWRWDKRGSEPEEPRHLARTETMISDLLGGVSR